MCTPLNNIVFARVFYLTRKLFTIVQKLKIETSDIETTLLFSLLCNPLKMNIARFNRTLHFEIR